MCLSNYLELRPCRPRTEKLRQLLSECPYRGPEYEEEGEEGLVNEGEESGEDDKDDWEERRRTKSRKVKIDRPRKVCCVSPSLSFSFHHRWLRAIPCSTCSQSWWRWCRLVRGSYEKLFKNFRPVSSLVWMHPRLSQLSEPLGTVGVQISVKQCHSYNQTSSIIIYFSYISMTLLPLCKQAVEEVRELLLCNDVL